MTFLTSILFLSRSQWLFAVVIALSDVAIAAGEAGSKPLSPEDQKTMDIISAHSPSRLKALLVDFNARFGATHSDGKYYFTSKPFLIEGAEKLIGLGTNLGKFWFSVDAAERFYSFNSEWPKTKNLVDLAKTEYFQQVWKMPFKTLMLSTSSPSEKGWRSPGLNADYYARITQDYYEISAFFYKQFRDREITVILQNWEGDWMLRGIGKQWQPAPDDWPQRCEQMQRWIAAKQAGVNQARSEFGLKSRCTVAHAVEVNRVADAWKGIPTVTRNVLPNVEVDLVSYSAYDGINSGDPLLFWKCLDEIRAHIRTGPLFGPGAIMVGEYGIPENDVPLRIRERCDEMVGVMLAKNVLFAAHWELYCNEFARKKGAALDAPVPITPVTDPALMRGFWLVKPDGALSETGKYFHEMWSRAQAEHKLAMRK